MVGVITTNPARCRDCYACVRACPVKAVRVRGAQAQVVQELCIVCGTCVRTCPQGAKQVLDDRPIVRAALRAGRPVIASVAPSAPAFFDVLSFEPLASALAGLGFAAASETAIGAEMVGRAHRKLLSERRLPRPVITTACPVIVNMVEVHYPDLLPHMVPLVSPMVAHARWLRERYGPDACLVFVGPCLAKKGEARDEAVAGAVDATLTFVELQEWLDEAGVEVVRSETPEIAEARPPARLFPLEGGLVGTAGMSTDLLGDGSIAVSGLETCRDVLEGIRNGHLEAGLAELMACEGGCINGPGMQPTVSVSLRRQRLLAYAARRQRDSLPGDDEWPDLRRSLHDRSIPASEFSEEEIRATLARVEKHTPEDELNCGACGYPTCREKAIAALRGMSELTMCIPYMRSRAESLTNVVMDAVPNAVLVVDEQLHLQELSASAQRMLGCHRNDVVGRPLRECVPVVDPFLEVLRQGQLQLAHQVQLRPDLIVEMTVVPVQGKGLLVGVLRDITGQEKARAALAHLRTETLERTQAVITKQMRVAHEIAGLLGETTAETKVLLTELRRLLEKDASGEATG